MKEGSGVIHPGMTGRVHLCLRNVDRTGPGVICQSPSGPQGATDWSTAGGKSNSFIGTGAWLIKQVPLGQKAAGISLPHVPVSARQAGRLTPPHKERGDETLFSNIGMHRSQETHERMLLLGSIQILRFRAEEWDVLLDHPHPTVSIHPQPTPLNPTPQLYARAHDDEQIKFVLGSPHLHTCSADTHIRGTNATTNKLKRAKSCQAEHRIKIRHPCPPSQPETSWSNLGRFQRER